jgi:hypothetical protein
MLTDSCLCGSVAYEVDAPAGPIVHCHCTTCRKTHGAAFSTVMPVPRAAFRCCAAKSCCRASNRRPASCGGFAPDAARISSPIGRTCQTCCCGWGVSTRRSPTDRSCTCGDPRPRAGTTRATPWPNFPRPRLDRRRAVPYEIEKHCLSRSARLLHPRRKPDTSDFYGAIHWVYFA